MRKGLNKAQFLGYKVEETKNGNPYCKMMFSIDGQKKWNYVWEPSKEKVYEYGKEKTDPESIEANRKSIYKMLARPAMILVGEEKVKEAIRNVNNFKDYCLTLKGLIDPTENSDLDVFLQYQYKMQDGKDRTFLEIPNTEANGIWVAEHTGEFRVNYNEPYDKKTIKAITFVNAEGQEHPIHRDGWFKDSNYWHPQGVTMREGSKPATPTVTEPEVTADDDLPF